MTTLREAAQQALEALEAMQSYAAAERKGLRICDEAIPALRAALAQQAEPPGCDHCNHPLYAATKCRVCGRVTEQAEPVEPVAWMFELARNFNLEGYGGWEKRITEYRPITPEGSVRNVTPLYTAPPQRKPLTDEEINEIAQTNLGDYRDGEWHLLFARAVEAAHGINHSKPE